MMLHLSARRLPARFRRIEQTLDSLEGRFLRTVRNLERDRVDLLLPLVAAVIDGGSLAPLDNLGGLLPGAGRYEPLLTSFVTETLGAGIGHGQAEVDELRARGRKSRVLLRQASESEVEAIPEAAIEFVQKRRDLAAFFEADQVEAVRQVLAQALQDGSSVPTVMQALNDALPGHFGTARAENIARTEATTAYNQGRLHAFLQAPDLVAGLQFMAILDARTTDICQHRDGLVFAIQDPLLRENTPPLHYQCRSLLSPVPPWELDEMGGPAMLEEHRQKMLLAAPTQVTKKGRFGNEAWPTVRPAVPVTKQETAYHAAQKAAARAAAEADDRRMDLETAERAAQKAEEEAVAAAKEAEEAIKNAIEAKKKAEELKAKAEALAAKKAQEKAAKEAQIAAEKAAEREAAKALREAAEKAAKEAEERAAALAAKVAAQKAAYEADLNDPKAIIEFVRGEPLPVDEPLLGGIPLKPAPAKFWQDPQAKKTPGSFQEPEFKTVPGKGKSAGCIMVENDGRVWIYEPTNHYGGYEHTFPKGGMKSSETDAVEVALRETWEETGLQSKVFFHLGDYEKTSSTSRYYVGARVSGDPTLPGYEAQKVKLVPVDQLGKLLTHPSDQKMVSDLKGLIQPILDGTADPEVVEAFKLKGMQFALRLQDTKTKLAQAQALEKAKKKAAERIIKAAAAKPVPPAPAPAAPSLPPKVDLKPLQDAWKDAQAKVAGLKAAKKQAAEQAKKTWTWSTYYNVKQDLEDAQFAANKAKAALDAAKKQAAARKQAQKVAKEAEKARKAAAKAAKPLTAKQLAAKAKKDAKAIAEAKAKGQAEVLEFRDTEWTLVGGQKGSNQGGTYRNLSSGEEWYIKRPNDMGQARNEKLAADLYRLAGNNAADTRMVRFEDGSQGLASKIIPGFGVDKSGGTLKNGQTWAANGKPVKLNGLDETYASHAWLANWDCVGLEYDNLGFDQAGQVWVIDTGGSLTYRAQGGLKGVHWNDQVSEWESLRTNPNNKSSLVFGHLKDNDKRLLAGAKRVAKVKDAKIREAVYASGLDGAEAEEMVTTLIKRRDVIAKKVADIESKAAQVGSIGPVQEGLTPYMTPVPTTHQGGWKSVLGVHADPKSLQAAAGGVSKAAKSGRLREKELASHVGKETARKAAELGTGWQSGSSSYMGRKYRDEWARFMAGEAPIDPKLREAALAAWKQAQITIAPGPDGVARATLYRGFTASWNQEEVAAALLLGKTKARLQVRALNSWTFDKTQNFGGVVLKKEMPMSRVVAGQHLTAGWGTGSDFCHEQEFLCMADTFDPNDSNNAKMVVDLTSELVSCKWWGPYKTHTTFEEWKAHTEKHNPQLIQDLISRYSQQMADLIRHALEAGVSVTLGAEVPTVSDFNYDEIAKTLLAQQAQLEAEIREMESQGLIMDMGPPITEVKDWRELSREASANQE